MIINKKLVVAFPILVRAGRLHEIAELQWRIASACRVLERTNENGGAIDKHGKRC